MSRRRALAAAKDAARAIARALPNDRVGLLVFAGSGFRQLPATADRATWEQFLDAASPSNVPDLATDIEAAVGVAARVAREDGTPASTALVILSDGEDNEGKLEGSIRTLQAAGLRTFAVGVGTAAGTTIDERDASGQVRPHTDWAGRVVITRLMETNLSDIARRTGGVAVRWSGSASVAPVVASIAQLPPRAIAGHARAVAPDRYQWPLGAALLAWLLPSLPGVGRPRTRHGWCAARCDAFFVLVAAIVLAAGVAARAGAGRIGLVIGRQRAARLYAVRQWHEAADAFQGLLRQPVVRHTGNAVPLLSYDLGTTQYRLGRFDAAAQSLHAALGADARLAARAYYNLGNTYIWQARASIDHTSKRMALRAAVESYEEALVRDPGDIDAKWNLEVALRRLDDATDHSSMSRHRNAADWGGGNLTKSGYAGTPQTGAGATPGGGLGPRGGGDAVPEITETHARQLLDAIERAQVSGQELQGPQTRNPPRPSHEPDW